MQEETSASSVADTRVVWLFNCIGTADSLLYWNAILPRYLEHFPHSDFFTARPPTKAIPGTDKIVECSGSWRIPLGRRRGSYDRQIVLAAPTILRRLRHIRPDVIVVQEFLSMAIYLAMFRNRLPTSSVLLLLESDPVRGIPERDKRWARTVRTLVARRMDLFLTNNESGRRYLTKVLRVPAQRVLAKPYLVSEFATSASAQTFEQLPSTIRDDCQKTVFLYVGQLVERKGVEQLLRALALVQDAARKQARLWLVGDGEQRERLQRLSVELGLEDLVRFLGHQPYESLAAFYDHADIFVMPTLDDYRALVGFEAIARGLPLLHSKYDGAVSELVEEGHNGFVVDPRATRVFAETMQRMIRNSDQLPKMGRRSQERSENHYTVENAVANICLAIDRCRETSNKRERGQGPSRLAKPP